MTRPKLASIEQRYTADLPSSWTAQGAWRRAILDRGQHSGADVPALSAAIRDVLAVADQLDRLAARHPDSETGHVETAAAHEIRAAITARIDTTPKEKP